MCLLVPMSLTGIGPNSDESLGIGPISERSVSGDFAESREALDVAGCGSPAQQHRRIGPVFAYVAHRPSSIKGLERSSPKWNRGNALSEMVSATVKS